MSVSKLKSIIEALSWNKMSVLHWHITEMDSFPLVLDSVPQLAENQSFSSQQVYTKKDVSDIIAWGRMCGVRVVPEIDMPGHMTGERITSPASADCNHNCNYYIDSSRDAFGLRSVGPRSTAVQPDDQHRRTPWRRF